MLDIDLSSLKKYINTLQKIIDDYDSVQLNIFNQINNGLMNWSDNNSLLFETSIDKEKLKSNEFVEYLTTHKELFDYIYNQYSSIGKRIKCNLNKKNSIINLINSCYDQASNIIYYFRYVDTSFYYAEKSYILSVKNKIYKVRSNLDETYSYVTAMFRKIETIENEINSRIKKMDEITLENYSFNFN